MPIRITFPLLVNDNFILKSLNASYVNPGCQTDRDVVVCKLEFVHKNDDT